MSEEKKEKKEKATKKEEKKQEEVKEEKVENKEEETNNYLDNIFSEQVDDKKIIISPVELANIYKNHLINLHNLFQ